MTKGLFVTIEGPEGVGKTTQAEALLKKCQENDIPAIYTREPGGTPIGEHLRDVLLHGYITLAPPTELLLMVADRAQHVYEKIVPALDVGKVVICDRYFDSTAAYQGIGRGISPLHLKWLHEVATGNLMPDLTFVMIGAPFRELGGDKIEKLGNDFHRRIRGYFNTASMWGDRYVSVNANQDQVAITDFIYSKVKEKL